MRLLMMCLVIVVYVQMGQMLRLRLLLLRLMLYSRIEEINAMDDCVIAFVLLNTQMI